MKAHHFIEKFWYPSSKFRTLIYCIFWIPNLPFLLLVKLKYFLYNRNLIKSNHFSKPVLVVGNITVGGTGKTPFITSLVTLLKDQNVKCGIVSRGYQSKIEQVPHQVSCEDTAIDVGDEALMQFNKLQIPIVIDSNRSRAVKHLINNNQVDVIISDDGLQHYKMQRDFEVVLVDAYRSFGNQLIMPFGPLREPVSRINNIDLLLKNGNALTSLKVENKINCNINITPKYFVNLKTQKRISVAHFKNTSVCAVAGIGNPVRFFDTLEDLCSIQKKLSFPDHHNFSEDDFSFHDEFKNDDMSLVMTEKDAVKCQNFAKHNWYYLEVEMQLSDELSNCLLSNIKEIIERKKNG